MKTTLLPATLAAAALLSSCGCPYFSCNTAEIFDPPDKRVALVNGAFPKRFANTYTPTAVWKLDGHTYHEVTVQYARPHRPFLRQSERGFESMYARRMTAEETKNSFTIDPAIPARRYLLTRGCEPIPAEEFDFRRAKRWKETPQNIYCLLVKNEFPDIPGTPSTWRSIAQAPLQIVDMGVSLTLNTAWIASGFVLLPLSAIFHPLTYISEGGQQQQPTHHETNPATPAHGTQSAEPERLHKL
jgi:hypothetical protein